MLFELLGTGLVGASITWLGLSVASQIRRERFAAERRGVELELLRNQLNIERDLREAKSRSPLPWNGLRKFVVKRKVMEGEGQCSFYLAPHDGKALPEFLPGQYLTFQLPIPGKPKPVVRCYSLSDRPRPEYYRVTIKRQPPPPDRPELPPGVGSTYFHDQVEEGDILDVKAPSGHFFLDPAVSGGVVLIGGGIGLTPMMSMLQTLIAQDSRREVWLFYGVRNGAERIMSDALAAASRERPNVHIVTCHSQPSESEQAGVDFDHKARVSVALFKKLLPSNNFDYYMCGPGPMMETVTRDLRDWGVPDTRIHFETFGPSSVRKVSSTQPPMPIAGKACSVAFKRSGKSVAWTGQDSCLLDLAERHGVSISSGCRAGNCGTCVVAIQGGDVSYVQPPGSPPDPGTCLTCVAAPKGDIVLDA